MNSDKIFKGVVNEHECALRMFKEAYSFDIKQQNILFYLETTLRKYQAEQLVDQNKMTALNKKIDKRQILIEGLIHKLEISKGVTELDIFNDRE